jgi:hypothetical protein
MTDHLADEPVAVVGTPPWQVHDSPPPTHGTPGETAEARAELAEVTAERDAVAKMLVGQRGLYQQALDMLAEVTADRDRKSEHITKLAKEATNLNSAKKYAEAGRNAAGTELGKVSIERDGWQAEAGRWRQRAETAESRVDGQAWAELSAEVERLRVLVGAGGVGGVRDELATARRAAAADALDWAAAEWDRRAFGMNEWPTVGNLATWAAEVRAGQRTIPTQPATTGTDTTEET